jgi:hypothetical protein
LNPLIASKLDHFLLTLPERLSKTANEDDKEFHQHVQHKKRKLSLISEIVDIELSATQIPLSIFTNLFHKRFQNHSMLKSMLEILQQFNIQMETEHHVFFPWRFCLTHFKVYEMSQACYILWFNWRNSITCTYWNVISVGHDSFQQRAKSQRIEVDATSFHII